MLYVSYVLKHLDNEYTNISSTKDEEHMLRKNNKIQVEFIEF